jgi:hypothetical protein
MIAARDAPLLIAESELKAGAFELPADILRLFARREHKDLRLAHDGSVENVF